MQVKTDVIASVFLLFKIGKLVPGAVSGAKYSFINAKCHKVT